MTEKFARLVCKCSQRTCVLGYFGGDYAGAVRKAAIQGFNEAQRGCRKGTSELWVEWAGRTGEWEREEVHP